MRLMCSHQVQKMLSYPQRKGDIMDNQNIRQQLQDAYQNRVAIRVYQDKKIPQEDLDTILDAA